MDLPPRYREVLPVLIAIIGSVAVALSAWAQVATDGSLGTVGATTLTGPVFQVGADLGQTVCNANNTSCNIFHSFSEFSVASGETAVFTGPMGIDPGAIHNVFARVTGPWASQIDGRLRTTAIPNADFYLINPNGVVFGPGAQLELGGSLVVTTADELQWRNGEKFLVTSSPGGSVLTVAAPSAFGFLAAKPAGVEIVQSTLAVGEGQGVTVISGDIQVDDGGILSNGGPIGLISVASAGAVDVEQSADPSIGSWPNLASFQHLGDVNLVNDSAVVASGKAGGAVVVAGEDLTLRRSTIQSDTLGVADGDPVQISLRGHLLMEQGEIRTQTFSSGRAGDLKITADGFVIDGQAPGASPSGVSGLTLGGNGVSSATVAGGSAGDVSLKADSLTILRGAVVGTSSVSGGDGGLIAIDVDSLLLDGEGFVWDSDFANQRLTGVFSQTLDPVSGGRGGDVTIRAHTVEVFEGAHIATYTTGVGQGGDIEVLTSGLMIDGQGFIGPPQLILPTGISTSTFASATSGRGGAIKIQAKQLTLNNRAGINSDSFGVAEAGDVHVISEDLWINARSFIGSSTSSSADAGHLTIESGHLSIDGGGLRIDFGPAHDVIDTIEVFKPDGTTEVIDVAATANLGSIAFGSGQAGVISVLADRISIIRQGLITSSGVGSGNAGKIIVDTEHLEISRGDSRLFSGIIASARGGGSSGTLRIDADELNIIDGGLITTNTIGGNDGGDIRIQSDSILLEGNPIHNRLTGIGAQTSNPGNGGDGGTIQIQASRLEIGRGSVISAATFGSGNGGQIEVTADSLLLDAQDSFAEIQTASLGTGDAGDILVTTPNGVRSIRGGSLASSALFANSGDISVTAGETIDLFDSTISAAAAVNGGNINLTASQRVQLVDSTLTAQAGQNGASINLGPRSVILRNSVINGLAGGDPVLVEIDPNAIFLNSHSQILTAAASLPPQLDLSGSLSNFPESLIGHQLQLQPSCAVRFTSDISSFSLEGQGGLPLRPDGWVPGLNLVRLRSRSATDQPADH